MSEPGTPSLDLIASLNEQIDRAIAEAATWRDHSDPTVDRPSLQFMEPVGGSIVALPGGRRIEDVAVWIDAPAEPRAVFYAALHLLRGIRAHGSGRVWWLAPTPNGKVIHLVRPYGKDSAPILKGADGGDCVRLRTLYFHEALAKPGTTS
jgi:hypothetical protein